MTLERFSVKMDSLETLTNELQQSLKILERLTIPHENNEENWKTKEANYVKIQVELKSKNDALKAQNYQLALALEDIKAEYSALQAREKNGDDKIVALRNVARALEAENQLLASEKEHLERFKNQFCNDNGSLRYASLFWAKDGCNLKMTRYSLVTFAYVFLKVVSLIFSELLWTKLTL